MLKVGFCNTDALRGAVMILPTKVTVLVTALLPVKTEIYCLLKKEIKTLMMSLNDPDDVMRLFSHWACLPQMLTQSLSNTLSVCSFYDLLNCREL